MSGPRFYKPPQNYAHGTRARYRLGCDCVPCTAANTTYGQTRARARAAGQWNGLVDASETRAYLLKLQGMGVGLRRVSHLTGLPVSGIRALRSGQRQHLRALSAKRILELKPSLAKGQRVNAYRTRHLLACLLNEGYTRKDLAARLGLKSPTVQLHNEQVTVRNALKIRGLFACLTGDN